MSLTAAIHVAKNQLGMDEETYRAFLTATVGKDSCGKMTARELKRVLMALEECGFELRESSRKPSDLQARKIRALWLAMADAGIIHNRTERALDAYCQRICGLPLRFASVKQCQAIIETLKAWEARHTAQHPHTEEQQ